MASLKSRADNLQTLSGSDYRAGSDLMKDATMMESIMPKLQPTLLHACKCDDCTKKISEKDAAKQEQQDAYWALMDCLTANFAKFGVNHLAIPSPQICERLQQELPALNKQILIALTWVDYHNFSIHAKPYNKRENRREVWRHEFDQQFQMYIECAKGAVFTTADLKRATELIEEQYRNVPYPKEDIKSGQVKRPAEEEAAGSNKKVAA